MQDLKMMKLFKTLKYCGILGMALGALPAFAEISGLRNMAEQYLAHHLLSFTDQVRTAPLAAFQDLEDAPATRAAQRWRLLSSEIGPAALAAQTEREIQEDKATPNSPGESAPGPQDGAEVSIFAEQNWQVRPTNPLPKADLGKAAGQSAVLIQEIFQEGILSEEQKGLAKEEWPIGLAWPQVPPTQIAKFFRCIKKVAPLYAELGKNGHDLSNEVTVARINQFREHKDAFFCTNHLGVPVEVPARDEWWNVQLLSSVKQQKLALGYFLNAYATANQVEGKAFLQLSWQLVYQYWAVGAAQDVLAPPQLKAAFARKSNGFTDFNDTRPLLTLTAAFDYLTKQWLIKP